MVEYQLSMTEEQKHDPQSGERGYRAPERAAVPGAAASRGAEAGYLQTREGTKKYTDGELEEILADESRPVFVCEREGKVQGYAFCIFQETKENGQLHPRKVLYLDDLCVDAEARRQHVGADLYHYVLDFARETGCDSVTLNVWSVNGEAEAFYERMGMKPLKTTMETLL